VFTGQAAGAESAFGVQGPLHPFRTHGVDVFSYWFYAPAAREYRLVYWLTGEQPYPALLTLTCENARLVPLADHLTPAAAYNMLDAFSQKPEFAAARNLLILPYLALDTVPCVISFKASERAESAMPRLENPLLQPALGGPVVTDVPSMRR
jgi:hypothetical protein